MLLNIAYCIYCINSINKNDKINDYKKYSHLISQNLPVLGCYILSYYLILIKHYNNNEAEEVTSLINSLTSENMFYKENTLDNGVGIFAHDGNKILFMNSTSKKSFQSSMFTIESQISLLKSEDSENLFLTQMIQDIIQSGDYADILNDNTNFIKEHTKLSSTSRSHSSIKYLMSKKKKTASITKHVPKDASNLIQLGVFKLEDQGKDTQYFDVYFKPFYLSTEKSKLLFLYMYNITELKSVERSKIEIKLKNNFFNKIAHEFKTPLIVISSLSQKVILKIKEKNIKQSMKYTQDIISMSDYTVSLIQDLIHYSLDFNKMKNEVKMNNSIVYVNDILSYCNSILTSLLSYGTGEKQKVKPILNIDNSLEKYTFNIDCFRLKQILINFISNSVKFTKNGSITIEAKPLYYDDLTSEVSSFNLEKADSIFEFDRKNSQQALQLKRNYSKVSERTNNVIHEDKDEYNNTVSHSIVSEDGSKNDDYTHLIISIKDTGVGIDSEKLLSLKTRISSMNLNLESSYNDKLGSGIGLSVAYFLSKLLNIKLSFDSYLNTGSIFSIVVPCSKDPNDCKPIDEFDELTIVKDIYPIENKNEIISTIHGKYNKLTNIPSNQQIRFSNKRLSSPLFKDSFQPKRNTRILQTPPQRNITYVRMCDESPKILEEIGNIHDMRRKSNIVNSLINNKIDEIKELKSFLSENEMNRFETNCLTKIISISANNLSQTATNKSPCLPNSILICDDSSMLRQSLKMVLNQIPGVISMYNIIECKDGIETLMKIIEDQVDGNKIKAVFTDENMEYMNGSDSIKILKRLEYHNKIKKCKYFSITAFDDENTKDIIINSGVEEILSKPPSKSVISALLKKNELL